jgi:anaerobic sulfite reductase subunit B
MMIPSRYRVVGRVEELDDTVTLTVEPVDQPVPDPEHGQFNMLWAFGVGEVPISVSARSPHLAHTIRAVGATTTALCALGPGDMIGVRGPFGTGWDLDDVVGGDLVVIGGGIGLAPVRSVVRSVLAERDRFGHVAVLVGARSPDLLLYRRELEEWQRGGEIEVLVTVDSALSGWTGRVGVVTGLIEQAGFEPARTTAMVCGPEVMMRFCARALVARGVPAERVRVSLERNMMCAVAQCGHCQIGPAFVCRDGPVFDWATAAPMLEVRQR